MTGAPEEDIHGEYKDTYIYIQGYTYISKRVYIYIYIYMEKMEEQGINSHVNIHLRKILKETIK